MSARNLNPADRLALSNRVFNMLDQEAAGVGRFCGRKAAVLERLRGRYMDARGEVDRALQRAAEAARS